MNNDSVKTEMDQDVVNLAKAVRQKESNNNFEAVGDNGTSRGAYQWQPATWKEHSTKTFGKEVEMTPENQNAVAYTIMKSWKDQGLNPAQIAAKWNSGKADGWETNVGRKKINGKWIVNGKPHSEILILEIGLLNEFFADFNLTTNQRCKKFCNCKINELLVDCEIVEPTKVFDEKFDNPIDQIDNFLNNNN